MYSNWKSTTVIILTSNHYLKKNDGLVYWRTNYWSVVWRSYRPLLSAQIGHQCGKVSHGSSVFLQLTEVLKGHRVVWKIEIYYLIRMTYEWKSMSSGWHNNIVVTHPDEIPISAKSSGWHMVVWYVIRMTYCSVQKSSGWDTARS